MTLPSNISTTEPVAIPSDPFACLAPATAQATAGAPTCASFDSVFSSQAGDATVTATVDAAAPCVPSLPLVAGLPNLYPGMAYMTAPAAGSTPVAKTEIPVEVVESEVQDDKSEQPETAKAEALPVSDEVLAYQLIAGQWVQQASVPPLAPAPRAEPAPSAATFINNLGRHPVITSTVAKDFSPASSAVEQHGKMNAEFPAVPAPATPKTEISPERSVESSSVKTSAATKPQAPVTTASASIAVKSEDKTPASVDVVDEKNLPLSGLKPTPAPAFEAPTAPTKNPLVAAAIVPASESGKPIENELAAAGVQPVSTTPEKIAAPRVASRAESVSGVNSSNDGEEKKTLIIDNKNVRSASAHVGTRGANREFSMSYSVATKPVSTELMTTLAVAGSGGIQSGTTAQVAETRAPIAVQAPRLVEEIRAIADRISVIDRNSVEVRFDFSDSERLSVRVEYRDGTVHTTFRTDSSQLRDVISHEWQAQAAAADQRSYRVADPVFNSPDTKQQNFSSLDDGSGRHRGFEQPTQSGLPFLAGPGRPAGSTTSAAAPSPAARTETSRHLHTFA